MRTFRYAVDAKITRIHTLQRMVLGLSMMLGLVAEASAQDAPVITASVPALIAVAGIVITPITITSTGGTVASYAINPAIGNGLSFADTTGTISGTPIAVASVATYTITATNGVATDTATVEITVNADTAPAFAETVSAQDYPTATAVSTTLPAALGGNGGLTYALTPALPDGLTFDATASTITITGTPTAVVGVMTYTLTVTDADANTAATDTDTLTFSITVSLGAPAITASVSTLIAVAGIVITPITITSTGGTVASYAINPAIGNGLSFADTTGTISGTPIAVASVATYTITATNGVAPNIATDAVMVTITVTLGTAPTFGTGAMVNAQTYTTATAVSTTLPAASGGDGGLTYALTPALPAGLAFDATASTITITGTPTAVVGVMTYTLTVTDADANTAATDTDTLTFTITVNLGAPAITASVPTLIAAAGIAITPITITSTGGAVAGYGINPSIDNGLLFSTRTGAISGTPAAVAIVKTYTITATNTTGMDTVMVTITVNAIIDETPTFGSETVSAQAYTTATAVSTTLPAATGGNSPLTYTLTPALPDGLTFDATARTITGTPTAVVDVMTYTLTVTDADANTAATDTDTLTFTITVNLGAPAITASVPTLTAVAGIVITPITITSTGGTVASYAINPAIGNGLSFADTTGTISGTPIAVASVATYTITATNGVATDAVMVTITVNADTAPAFATGAMVGAQTYTTATAVSATLPAASGGDGDLTYALTPATLPAGLTFDATASTITITGTPTAVVDVMTYTLTVTDADSNTEVSDADTLTFTITVNLGAPAITASVLTLAATMGTAITPITITSTGGTVASYSISPDLVAGLSLDATTGTISGTPTAAVIATIYTITATNGVAPNIATGATTVEITVNADTAPAFATGAMVGAQTYTTATAVSTTLPAATGGNSPLTYTLTPALPDGLTFDATASTITGTPTAVVGMMTYTLTVTDADANTAATDTDTLTFTITVNLGAPAITASVPTLTVVTGTAITPVTITSTGGTVASYAINPDLVAGLSLDATTGTISGTPTAAVIATIYTITATNGVAPNIARDAATVEITVNEDETPAFATGAMVNAQTYTTGVAVAVTLPAASGGNSPLTYKLTPTFATGFGLTFTAATRVISGTPMIVAASVQYTLTVSDTDNNEADTDTLTFSITVNADARPAFATGATVPAQTYTVGTAVNTPLLPAATGGNSPLTYTLRPALPTGLTFTSTVAGRIISGIPTAIFRATAFNLRATDADADTDTLTFSITVNADTTPAFATGAMVDAQTYNTGVAVAAVTLPEVTGGNSPLTYTLTPALPDGLTFDATARTITGTPTAVVDVMTYTLTVTDADANTDAADSASLTFTITVDLGAPDITASVSALTAVAGVAITPVTITTSGGEVASYKIKPAIGNGLSFSTMTGAISGTPPTTAGAVTYTITATNSASANMASTTVIITVIANAPPTFGMEMVMPLTYIVNTPASALTLPKATGGNGALTYALTPAFASGSGLTFDKATRIISGTPTAMAVMAAYTLTASDADGDKADSDTGSLTFYITVNADTVPAFAATVANQTYNTGTVVDTTLPEATGGNGDLAYTLTPATLPAGLTFVDTKATKATATASATTATRTITGTPTAVATEMTYTLTASDADGNTDAADSASLTFTITVNLGAPVIMARVSTLTVAAGIAITPVTITSTGGAVDSYKINPPFDNGLSFSITSGMAIISGTPGSADAEKTYTITATNGTGMATATIAITVEGMDTTPTFATGAMVNAQTYTTATAVSTTLPAASGTGGNGALTYALTPALPDGLTFDATARTITGTPTAVVDVMTYTLTVSDTDNGADTLTFSIIVNEAEVAPTFGVAIVMPQTYAAGKPVNVTLPEATGGNGVLTYALAPTPALPAGLTFATATRTITGTPTAVVDVMTYTLTVTDADANTDATDSASLTFTITVVEDTAPTFGVAKVANQVYATGTAVTATLPEAIGGNNPLTYTLTPATLPAGLTFDAATRVISGTPPTTAVAPRLYTLTASDADGDPAAATAGFYISVIVSICSRTETVQYAIVAAIDGVSDCSDVTTEHLSAITTLNLRNKPISALKVGDFTGLSALTGLNMGFGQLTTLPAGLFAGLSKLTKLYLDANQLTTLPAGLFTGLSALAGLDLKNNQLTTLPAGLFTGLSALKKLGLGNNQLTTLPAGIFADISTAAISLDDNNIVIPVANAGADRTVTSAAMVTLQGSADVYPTTVAPVYSWTQTGTPAVTLLNPNTAMPTFTASMANTLTFSLAVTISNGGTTATSAVDTVIITVSSNSVPTFSMAVDNQAYTTYTVVDVTLPAAAGANSYTLTPALPAGLSFNGGARTITGIPTIATTSKQYTLTASDGMDANSLTFYITVNADALPTFGVATVNALTYTTGTAMPVTLPEATGGNGALTYALTPAFASGSGLTFESGAAIAAIGTTSAKPATPPSITGVPIQVATPMRGYTLTVSDADGDPASLTFSITVNLGAPAISATPSTLTVGAGAAIKPVTITSTSGGVVASYSISPAIGNGLSFDTMTGTISGTPTAVAVARPYTITATNDTDTDTAMVTITVEVNSAPAFAVATADALTYTTGTAMPVTLPEATGGNGVLTYALAPTPALPAGLTFATATRTITGTPTAIVTMETYTLTVSDADSGTANLTFGITVNLGAPVISASVSVLPAVTGTAIEPVTITSTSGGAVASYSISPTIGNDLSFSTTTGTISGTPVVVADAVTYTITATNTASTATAMVAITVEAETSPAFAKGTTVANQAYNIATAVAETLPAATGGNGALTYTLTPALPAGLTFIAATRIISGTPTAVTDRVKQYTLTASDADDNTAATDTASLTFSITVDVVAPAISASVSMLIAIKDVTIPSVTITSTGGAVASYSISPAIGNGLLFSTTTGAISGTPAAVAGAVAYTITATNAATRVTNMATATVTITVNATGIAPEQVKQLNEAIMSRLTQAALASTLSSISSRIDKSFSGVAASTNYQLDGLSLSAQPLALATLLQKLPNYVHASKDGSMNWRQMLANSSFTLSLQNAKEGGKAGASKHNSNSLVVWGGGDYTSLGDNSDGLDWDGEIFSAQMGIDKRINNLLAGGLVSWSNSDVNVGLVDSTGVEKRSNYQHQMTSIHPYLAWSGDSVQLWGSLGYGKGELEIDLLPVKLKTDTSLLSLAAGVEARLSQKLSLKSDVSLAQTDIDGTANSDQQDISSQRLRLLLKADLLRCKLSTSALEVGLRYDTDNGDGSGTNVGIVLNASTAYVNPANNLTMEAKVHTLLGQGDYTEWGISGLILLRAAGNGRGLAFSLTPSYSNSLATSGTEAIWQQNQADNRGRTHANTADYQTQLDTRLSYGVSAPGGKGLLSPYSEMTFGSTNSYRLGIRWQRNDRFDLDLFGERLERVSERVEHAILLKSTVRF